MKLISGVLYHDSIAVPGTNVRKEFLDLLDIIWTGYVILKFTNTIWKKGTTI